MNSTGDHSAENPSGSSAKGSTTRSKVSQPKGPGIGQGVPSQPPTGNGALMIMSLSHLIDGTRKEPTQSENAAPKSPNSGLYPFNCTTHNELELEYARILDFDPKTVLLAKNGTPEHSLKVRDLFERLLGARFLIIGGKLRQLMCPFLNMRRLEQKVSAAVKQAKLSSITQVAHLDVQDSSLLSSLCYSIVPLENATGTAMLFVLTAFRKRFAIV